MKLFHIKNKKAIEVIKLILSAVIIIIFLAIAWTVLKNFLGVGAEYRAFNDIESTLEAMCYDERDSYLNLAIHLPTAEGGPSKNNPCWIEGPKFCKDATYFSIILTSEKILKLDWSNPSRRDGGSYRTKTLDCPDEIEISPFTLESTIDQEDHLIEFSKTGNRIQIIIDGAEV
jgi:hypothetical protein